MDHVGINLGICFVFIWLQPITHLGFYNVNSLALVARNTVFIQTKDITGRSTVRDIDNGVLSGSMELFIYNAFYPHHVNKHGSLLKIVIP